MADNMMKSIRNLPLADSQAAAWFLGQAGFILRDKAVTLAIDPYLGNSVGRQTPDFMRDVPVPIEPHHLHVDIFVATHLHEDHLDSQTVGPYGHKETTAFVGPRFACSKFLSLGVPPQNVFRIDSGEEQVIRGVRIRGMYAIATEPAAIDTAGYVIEFPNGRSFYHSADTAWSDLLAVTAAQAHAEVMTVCINGKMGNLNVDQAVQMVAAAQPTLAIPHHYDMFRLNSENPLSFVHFMRLAQPAIRSRILNILEPMLW